MPESPLDKLVPEQDFARLLVQRSRDFLSLAAAPASAPWSKRRLFELSYEANLLESLLDDYGARTNRTYSTFTELVASARGFALAGLSLEHLARRLPGYGVIDVLPSMERRAALADVELANGFVRDRLVRLLGALLDEARALGISSRVPGDGAAPAEEEVRRFRLPQTVGQSSLDDEEHRVAEIASKYLAAVKMLDQIGLRSFDDPDARERFLRERCREEQARVFQTTVHNLQSAYDTYIKNTLVESTDGRLPRLRGHVSASLHLLEVVTQLTHFVERHERGLRSDLADATLQRLVPRAEVRQVTLDRLLVRARLFLAAGRELAEGLLPSYLKPCSLVLELPPDVHLHARPMALIVGVVSHHGTPVELRLGEKSCSAGSILELMVALGSNPGCRRVEFCGDERPLRDLERLISAGCGERGAGSLPPDLAYLRRD